MLIEKIFVQKPLPLLLLLFFGAVSMTGVLHAQRVRLRSQIAAPCEIESPFTSPRERFGEIAADGNVAVHGGYGCWGAFIYDISNPDAPVLASRYQVPRGNTDTVYEHFHELQVIGNRGYFGSIFQNGVHIVDLTDPYHPVLLGVVDPGHGNGFTAVHEMIVSGNYLIENRQSSSNRITKIINVSNPANPVFVAEVTGHPDGGMVHAMHVRGNRMYISGWGAIFNPGRTEIYDITNVESNPPTLLGTIIDSVGTDYHNNDWTHSSWTTEDGNYLYSCRERFPNPPLWEGGDVRVYDVRNPAEPILVNRLTTIGLGLNAWTPHNPIVKGNQLYISWYHAGMQLFDITDPTNPRRIGQYDTYQPALAPTTDELREILASDPRDVICKPGSYRSSNINTIAGAWTAIPLAADKVVIGDLDNGMSIVDVSRVNAPAKNQVSDFDGDGRTDLSVYSPATGTWSIERSSDSSFAGVQFGLPDDKMVTGDYDGDGKSDVAVFRPLTGVWYILHASGSVVQKQFGQNGDVPVPGDYDSDGRTDIAVWRPSNGVWYIDRSILGLRIVQWGVAGDKAFTGDYEGDGMADLAIYRGGVWYILQSSSSLPLITQFGLTGDRPVVGNFDTDDKTDIAVFRPSDGNWYLLRSSDDSFLAMHFGSEGDIPIPADYDGDGKSDISVFRPGDRVWYRLNSTNGAFVARVFGATGDSPSPASAQPQ